MRFALEVIGDAMEPSLFEGDMVIVDPNVTPKGDTKDIAVFKISDRLYVSRFFKYGNQIVLLFDNAKAITFNASQINIVGRVMHSDFLLDSEEDQSHSVRNTFAFA